MTDVYENGRGPVPVPPPLVYVAGFLVGLGVGYAVPAPQPPATLRIVAAVLGVALLLALDTSAMLRFLRGGTPVNPARPARRLITTGPYRFSRNPMYLGMACAYAGAAVATGVLWALAVLPVVLLVIDFLVIPREERHLAKLFGEEYEDYRRRVRRWL
jgi:protein-S-isoprenylcysteine O-methyltransferase Ste14